MKIFYNLNENIHLQIHRVHHMHILNVHTLYRFMHIHKFMYTHRYVYVCVYRTSIHWVAEQFLFFIILLLYLYVAKNENEWICFCILIKQLCCTNAVDLTALKVKYRFWNGERWKESNSKRERKSEKTAAKAKRIKNPKIVYMQFFLAPSLPAFWRQKKIIYAYSFKWCVVSACRNSFSSSFMLSLFSFILLQSFFFLFSLFLVHNVELYGYIHIYICMVSNIEFAVCWSAWVCIFI